MGKFNKVISIIVGTFLAILLLLFFMIPYAIGPIILAVVLLVAVFIYLLEEGYSLSHRAVTKTFYCPFRKMIVTAKLRPSIFTFRTYDDVLKCSAFKDKVRCKKRCLDLPEYNLDSRPPTVNL